MKNLVIVESPAKAKTINKILGRDFVVKASMGHVRDLPEKDLGVDVENNFKPKYVNIKTREKVLKELKAIAKDADRIYLAPDPDREGEAIAWHLMAALRDKTNAEKFCRVTYNEITTPAIRKAFAEPREVDQNKVNSQQARRVLDRIVGYKVSPLLWRRIRGASSAGRVQSVAVRLVCEREREILNFKPEEYWILGAKVRKQVDPRDAFTVQLARINNEKADVRNAEQAHAIRADLEGRSMRVAQIVRREISKRPQPSFITSTLQQAGSRFFGFAPARTMKLAQKLYEGVDLGSGTVGLITYMRTDSPAISPVAQQAARGFVAERFGVEFLPDSPPVYRSRSGAQEAHEAIRPTDVNLAPDDVAAFLDADEFRLYRLIWQRFIASQMANAKIAQRTAEVEAVPPAGKTSTYLFRATASEVVFPGYLKVMGFEAEKKEKEDEPPAEGEEEGTLPPLSEGENLERLEWLEARKETQPPGRYTEASLIKALEEDGVGRPSTYASILSTIQARHYVEKDKRALKPSTMGFEVNDFLVHHLPELFDIKFTALMEAELDQVEEGKMEWTQMMKEFYGSFVGWVEKAKGPPADVNKVRGLLDLLDGVKNWAPPTKRGTRTYSDEKFVISVREQLDEGSKPVTDRQLEALLKLAIRYRDQLPGFDKAASKLDIHAELAAQAKAAEPPDASMLRKLELLQDVPFEGPREVRKKIYDDAKFVTSLREQAAAGKRLSDNQVRVLDRFLQKYSAHIPGYEEIARELNLELAAPGDPTAGPLLDLMHGIKEWKPATTRGKRTWDDQVFFKSLDEQFRRKKSLSPKQVSALKKMIRRYADQVPGYDSRAEELGLLPRPEAAPKATG